jgi:hypothetical protein
MYIALRFILLWTTHLIKHGMALSQVPRIYLYGVVGLKKAENQSSEGQFYGFAKSHSLLRWLDPTMETAKHAYGARFLELDPTRSDPTPGQRLLTLDYSSTTCDISFPDMSIYLSDRAHFDTELLSVTVQLPHIGINMDIKLAFDEPYHLPYIVHVMADGSLAKSLPPGFHQNAYLLAIGSHDPVTISDTLSAFVACQVPHVINPVVMWLVKRNNHPRTNIEEQRQMFNQVQFVPVEVPTIPTPVACSAVTSLTKPDCPEHVGQMVRNPFHAEFKFAHFENYDKMYSTGTWSYPVATHLLPAGDLILPIRSTYKVKSTET